MPTEILATYRLQFEPGFGFADAAAIAGYLARLGVTHVYSSPVLQAAPGSHHGYDVVDPHRVNEELGGEEGYRRLCEVLGAEGLGQVLDVVPNHMAIGTGENRWWQDVLENGPLSRFAPYFDVDWDPPEERFRNVILLPVLGDQYGRVLEAGELVLERRQARFLVRYHAQLFSLSLPTLAQALAESAERTKSETLAFYARAASRLGSGTGGVEVHDRDRETFRSLLERLFEEEPVAAEAVDAVLAEIQADPERLHALLERQNYRLAHWRMAARELGYRRFFDINTLIGLHVEDRRVFDDTHARVLRWVEEGVLEGLRIDHCDGLRDPAEYLRRLRDAVPRAWIIVEKILGRDERLPESWPVAGTTGYDFMNRVAGLFVDRAGERPLAELYAELTREPTDYAALVREKKRLALRDMLGSDLRRLADLLIRICERHRDYRDHGRAEAEALLCEVIACFPVYRSYVRAGAAEISAQDAQWIDGALEAAAQHEPDLAPDLRALLRDILHLRARGDLETELVMRLQQLTGPAMAKGVEDTLFYNFNRLVSLNEVGGHPDRFGLSPEEFHEACREAQTRCPLAMLATSTHDSKRSEDVRARIGLLSEIPGRWAEAVRRWFSMNERHRRNGLPDRNAEYLLYQTLVGAWPIGAERVLAYVQKASREAKAHTSWTRPDERYDDALAGFVTGVLENAGFLADLERFVAPLVEAGRITSLAQTLLKLTCPGIPDFYRGTELWDLSLVDPDNRRPVDWRLRARLLEELDGASGEAVLARMDEGLPKLWIIRQGLALRRERPWAFGREGDYRPLPGRGSRAAHVVAFLRGGRVAVVVPRLLLQLRGDWLETTIDLPEGEWRNVLDAGHVAGGSVQLADLLRRFPLALLSREEGKT